MIIADSVRLNREIMLRSLFPTMPAAAHARFVELLEERTVDAGESIFDAGDPPDHLMFLIEGRVVMERAGYRAWEFVPLAVVGVIDAVLDRPRTRGCRALSPSRLLSVKRSEWFDMLEDNAQIARSAVRNFAVQLHKRWRAFGPRLRRTSEPPPPISGPAAGTYDKIVALRRAVFLRSAGMQAVASLATVAEELRLERGQTLFELGQNSSELYVVARGVVELSAEPDFRFLHETGDLVGGAGALCHALPGYAARAASDATVLRISEQDFYDHAEEHSRITRGTLSYLVSELEALLELQDGATEP